MTDPYGARFIDEVRRLTKSTFGYSFKELSRVSAMDRTTFWAHFDARAPFGDYWSAAHRDLEAEPLAKAVVAEAQAQALRTQRNVDFALEAVFEILS